MSASIVPRYQLAPHVHACLARKNVVLLDLKGDCYFAVDRSECRKLNRYIAGLPVNEQIYSDSADTAICGDPPDLEDHDVLREMLKLGMLTTPGTAKRPASTDGITRPSRELIEGYSECRVRIRPLDVLSFVYASLRVACLQRRSTLASRIERIRKRRPADFLTTFDLDLAQERMSVFNRLRPMFYAEVDECFFNSLAALEFLALSGVHPRLVLGVTMLPFTAHCWLQYDDVVINDIPEYVRERTPILVV